MKIKATKKINLPELIRYVWENEVYPCRYINNFNGEVVFNDTGKFMTDESFISPNSYFTVEVEEELTNRTKLPDLVIVYNDNFIITDSDECISEYINDYDNESVSNRMYVPYKGGLKLVWSRKNGIPEHGVLEVGAE